MNDRRPELRLAMLLAVAALTYTVSAQVPDSIAYQGYLELDGAPVDNPSATLTFRLFDAATGGTELWEETQSGVSVEGGVFSVYLGAASSLEEVSFEGSRWLSVAVGGDSAPQLSPRTALVAAPYALGLRGLRVRPSTQHEYAPSLIGGYWKNSVAEGANSGTISGGGGYAAPNHVGGNSGTVGGGAGNNAAGLYSTISGGYSNGISADNGTIGGGAFNLSAATSATVGGGVSNQAMGDRSAVGGGGSNSAEGAYASVPGGLSNRAKGDYSFAAGYNAKARHRASFAFNAQVASVPDEADSLSTTADGQFLIRAPGGVGIGTNIPASPLTVAGAIESTSGGFVFPDGSVQTTAGTSGSSWALTGNTGTTAGTHFIGTTDDEPIELRVNGARGLRLESTSLGFEYGAVNVIFGPAANTVASGVAGATISGGGSDETDEENRIYAHYGTIGGGYGNVVGVAGSPAGDSDASTIGGGHFNQALENTVTIGGGGYGVADAPFSTIGGGMVNEARADFATVAGGNYNKAYSNFATVGGGNYNEAGVSGETTGLMATVAGGDYNKATGDRATVAGGLFNQATGSQSFVGGGGYNLADADFATIGGGGGTDIPQGNTVSDNYGTVGGGYDNQVGNNNSDKTDAHYATIAGGRSNIALEDHSTVGGGFANQANGPVSTVAGGWSNHADGERSFIGGGRDNRAGGYAAAVPGGFGNYANGSYSFAAGRGARAYNPGCFVWADNSTTTAMECKTNNRWYARAAGGVYFYTNAGTSSGAYLAAGGGSWNSLSDRAQKSDFRSIDLSDLLERISRIDIGTWRYVNQDPSIRHVGPTARDFNALLPELGGEGERFINSLDADGVALAAIQGLYEMVLRQQDQIRELMGEVRRLTAE
jgi:hypothetical protein